MAKKFHVFRSFQRNKTGAMAALTLLAIISFIFLPAILDLVGGGRYGVGGQIQTIAESRKFGRITEIELHDLESNHRRFLAFIEVLHRNLMFVEPPADMQTEEHIGEWARNREMALRPLAGFHSQIASIGTPEELVNAWLITQYSLEEGHVPTWADVTSLLRQLTGNNLTDTIYNDTLRATGMPHQAVERMFIRHLLWRRAMERFSLSASAVTPAARWDWFQRLNRQVAIEAAAVPIDTFISQVGEPTERQLNDFFAAHRARRHNPMSAEPGFIMPMELAFQYVVARPTQALLDSITEEEMLEYYEENKDTEFRRPVTPLTIPGVTTPFPTFDRNVITPMPMLPGMDVDIDTIFESPSDEMEQPEPTPAEPAETENAGGEIIEETTPAPPQ